MLKVLVVDDEPIVCQGLLKLIDWEKCGCSLPETVNNGKSALEKQLKEHYDLIITDIKMPLMDGITLISELRKAGEACEIIILSAYGEFEYARQAMQYGVRYYLTKPIDEQMLSDYVCEAVRRRSGCRQQGQITGDAGTEGEQEHPAADRQIIGEIKKYVSEHLQGELSLRDVSSEFSFSCAYLGRLFKKETGMSFHEYVNSVRIEEAKKLLLKTDRMIYEIAEKVGFNDVSYFIRTFRESSGVSPNAYRRRGKG